MSLLPFLGNSFLGGLIILQLIPPNCLLVRAAHDWTVGVSVSLLALCKQRLDALSVVHVAARGVPHRPRHLRPADGADGVDLRLGHCELIVPGVELVAVLVFKNVTELLHPRMLSITLACFIFQLGRLYFLILLFDIRPLRWIQFS